MAAGSAFTEVHLGTVEVARILRLSAPRVRSMVRAGLCHPARRGRAFRFSFQDLVLLRAAHGLLAHRMSSRRVRRAIAELSRQLPPGRPLSGVRIYAAGQSIVARDGRRAWDPDSGQGVLVFDVDELARKTHLAFARPQGGARGRSVPHGGLSADRWLERGLALEERNRQAAATAYRRALELDPNLAEAYVNLGRVMYELGDIGEALRLYWQALEREADDPITHYNLALALEDADDRKAAVRHYREALRLDADFPEAHLNLARLLERLGRRSDAVRHLIAYRRLTQGGESD